MTDRNICECTEDSLCKEAKRFWKLKSLKGRHLYSYHRRVALRLTHIEGLDIWADNFKKL